MQTDIFSTGYREAIQITKFDSEIFFFSVKLQKTAETRNRTVKAISTGKLRTARETERK